MAPGVTLHAVKVLNDAGVGSLAGLIEGIEYVTANHQKPAVAVIGVNTGFSQALNDAVAASMAAGVSYALPAGDVIRDACNYSPGAVTAQVNGALTVSATGIDDQASIAGNFGSCVDLYAPGLYIKSAWHTQVYANNTISHSPIAAAHVAGAAALIKADDPTCDVEQVKAKLLANSHQGVLSNIPNGTANRLLGVPTNPDNSPVCGGKDDASMVGETINMARRYPTIDSVYQFDSIDVTVVDGPSDTVTNLDMFTIDFDSNRIFFDYYETAWYGDQSYVTFNGYLFTGFVSPIKNVTAKWGGIVGTIDFGTDYIHLDMPGNTVTPDSWIELTIHY